MLSGAPNDVFSTSQSVMRGTAYLAKGELLLATGKKSFEDTSANVALKESNDPPSMSLLIMSIFPLSGSDGGRVSDLRFGTVVVSIDVPPLKFKARVVKSTVGLVSTP